MLYRTIKCVLLSSLVVGLFTCIVFTAVWAEEPIKLIIRGDDMGLSDDVNKAFIKAHKDGILTAASVMVPTPYFKEAVALCKANPKMSVGVHTTLINTYPTKPVLAPEEIPSLVSKAGFFYMRIEDFIKAKPRVEDIEKEIRAQIGKARASGLHFVYLDNHMFGFNYEEIRFPEITDLTNEVRNLLIRICKEQHLLLSGSEGENIERVGFLSYPYPKPYCAYRPPLFPKFRDERIPKFYEMLNNLKPGLTLSIFHPGFYIPGKAKVTEMLCTQKAKQIIRDRGIQLISYQDLWNEKYGKIK